MLDLNQAINRAPFYANVPNPGLCDESYWMRPSLRPGTRPRTPTLSHGGWYSSAEPLTIVLRTSFSKWPTTKRRTPGAAQGVRA